MRFTNFLARRGRMRRSRPIPTRLQVERLEERTVLSANLLGDFADVESHLDDATTPADIAIARTGALIVAGDPDGDPPDSPDLRVDPNTEKSPFAGVGSLRLVFSQGNATPFIGFCSAAAIGPRHVLTAAHCVDGSLNGKNDGSDYTQIEFWLNLDTDSPVDEPDAILPATRWYPHPDAFNPGNAYFHDDIAVIELATPLPEGVPFYELYTGDLAGRTVHMVGYGRSGDGVNGFTTPGSRTLKRVGQNVAEYFEGQDDRGQPEAIELWRADFDHPTDESLNVFGGPSLGNDQEANVGPGDSGGPAFVLVGSNPNKADSYQVGGVITHFIDDRTLPTWPLFGSVFGGTVVSAYLDWIGAIMAGNPPASAGGFAAAGGGLSGATGILSADSRKEQTADRLAIAALLEPLAGPKPLVMSSTSEPAPAPTSLSAPLTLPCGEGATNRFFAALGEEQELPSSKKIDRRSLFLASDDELLPDLLRVELDV